MPGNPTEYREHANRFLVLSGEASSPIAKAQLEYLAQTWMDLADVIDRTAFSRSWIVPRRDESRAREPKSAISVSAG